MPSDATVFVVDDDPGMRESLRWLIQSVGLPVEVYASAEDFLDAYDPKTPGCLVLDLRLPGMSGLRLQEELNRHKVGLPIILISGHAEISTAVHGLKAGAVDFLEKPFSDQMLLDGIRAALERDRETRAGEAQRAAVAARLGTLTPRQREVMAHVAAGRSNKEIGKLLGVSPKTVEVHRAQLMKKLRITSVAELTRLAVQGSDRLAGKPR